MKFREEYHSILPPYFDEYTGCYVVEIYRDYRQEALKFKHKQEAIEAFEYFYNHLSENGIASQTLWKLAHSLQHTKACHFCGLCGIDL